MAGDVNPTLGSAMQKDIMLTPSGALVTLTVHYLLNTILPTSSMSRAPQVVLLVDCYSDPNEQHLKLSIVYLNQLI